MPNDSLLPIVNVSAKYKRQTLMSAFYQLTMLRATASGRLQQSFKN